MKRIMAVIIKYKDTLLSLAKKWKAKTDDLNADMNLLQKSEIAVIKLYRGRSFEKEISALEKWKGYFKAKQHLQKDPFLDNDGILMVSDKINKANLDYRLKHTVLLPKESHITPVECRKQRGKICQ